MLNFGIGAEILIILLLVLVNGVFAMSEIAVISARRSRLMQRANAGDVGAAAALELAKHPNRFLSTAQIGITLVGIFAGAYGGATVAGQVDAYLRHFESLAPYSDHLSLGLVVLALTFLSLVVGELVPKRIALTYPESIASAVAGPMHSLSTAAAPLVRLLGASTDFLLYVLGVRKVEEPPVTEEEITAMIRLGTESGVIEEAEQDLVERVFRLGDNTVARLMTPRERIIALDLQDAQEVNRSKMIRHRVQRFLVCEGGLDNLLGMVPVTELWARMLAGEPLDLRRSLHMPLRIPDTTRALPMLEMFRKSDVHLALVLDAHQRIVGLVTLTDLLNQISGGLIQPEEPQIIQREDGSWLMDGALPMGAVWRAIRPELPSEPPAERPMTLGAFVVERLKHIPVSGEHFEAHGFRFEVVDMDGSHVDKVWISRQPAPEPASRS
jgi:putative hemolysin